MNPYQDSTADQWKAITEKLIDAHPLREHLVEYCLKSWESILNGKINTYLNLSIRDMSMSPQAIGALLHDIIPIYIERNSAVEGFRKGQGAEKDVVCEVNEDFSFEIKTSSQRMIYGNRSHALSASGRSKDGYYLAIIFEKLTGDEASIPRIKLIKFGWLSHSDWRHQASETGQKASLKPGVWNNKFIALHQDI